MLKKREIGSRFEEKVTAHLRSNGFLVIFRNYYVYGTGEIDLIATKGISIYFIEVRYRNGLKHGNAPSSIEHRKIKKIMNTSMVFLLKRIQYRSYKKVFLFVTNNIQNQGGFKFYKLPI